MRDDAPNGTSQTDPAGDRPVPTTPPSGTITFLFTDIEGSTRFWEQYPEAMQRTLVRHDALLRQVMADHGGYIFTTAGDAFSVAFEAPRAAMAASIDAQRRLASQEPDEMGPLRVRMVLHTGAADERDGDYFGPTLNRTARLLAAGHGGQILISLTTAELVRDVLPKGTGLRDLGEHRLRDLARPERVYQLIHPDLPKSFPSIRSLDSYAHNLPVQLTSFVGRSRDLEAVGRLIPGTRLLTLTGVGGAGKTRLALQAAAELVSEFRDGVWLTELGPVADGAVIAAEVAAILGVEQLPGRSMEQSLIEYLRSRHILLVMDNCEHVLDAVARLLDTVLRSCPRLQVLATSREALGIAGEVLYRVPSLSVPSPEEEADPAVLDEHEAVRLFVDRAAAVRPGFALTASNAAAVADISRRLDGIPLAIELAASRVRAMSPEQLAGRLDNRFALLTGGSRAALPRQQTLAAAMDWSYDLLAESERSVLGRLSVFRGSFSMEAAEQVGASENIDPYEVLDVLSRLVDKSLVVADERDDEMRYRMFETVRSYARGKLDVSGAAADAAARHAGYYLEMAESASAEMRGPREAEWLRRLETDHDNLRAAVEWALGTNDAGTALRFCWALVTYWVARGFSQEGLQLIERALQVSGDVDPLIRARGQEALAMLMLLYGDADRASALLTESRASFAELGARHDQALAMLREASATSARGDQAAAGEQYAEAAVMLEEVGDFWGAASCLEGQGQIALEQGDLEGARELFAKSLDVRRDLNHPRSIAQSLAALGVIALAEGAYERAGDLLEEALALFKDIGSKHQMASTTLSLGQVECLHGDIDWAESLLTEAKRLAVEAAGSSLASALLGSWALLARRRGDLIRAVSLWAAEEGRAKESGISRNPLFRRLSQEELDTLRREVPEDEYERVWSEGIGLGWLQALEQESFAAV